MYKFSNYLINNVLKKTIVYFAIVLFVLNLALYYINKAYEDEVILQDENSFTEIVKHIYSENDIDYVYEYLEHYSHIHNTSIKLIRDDEILFETSLAGDSYRDYYLDGNNFIIQIDSSKSNSVVLSDYLSIISNLVVLLAYIVSMYIFYRISRNKANFIATDLNIFSEKMKNHDLSDYKFSFIEFQELFDEFISINAKLNDVNLLKNDRLQAVRHDLNTSLTIIKSYLEGHLHGRMVLSNTEIEELIEEVTFNATLIDKLGSDQLNLNTTVDVSRLIKKISEKYIKIFDTKGIILEQSIEDLVYAKCNEQSLTRVIQNILSNAYYYSNHNTIVKVFLDKSADSTRIIIQDQGIGVSKDDLEKVFVKEFRSKDAIRSNASGKGIGLYTSRSLMQEMGGNLELKSNKEGTTVDIILYS